MTDENSPNSRNVDDISVRLSCDRINTIHFGNDEQSSRETHTADSGMMPVENGDSYTDHKSLNQTINTYEAQRLSISQPIDFQALSANFSTESLLPHSGSQSWNLPMQAQNRCSHHELLMSPEYSPLYSSLQRCQSIANGTTPRSLGNQGPILQRDDLNVSINEEICSQSFTNHPRELQSVGTKPITSVVFAPDCPRSALSTIRCMSPKRKSRLGRSSSPVRIPPSPLLIPLRGLHSPSRKLPFDFKPQLLASHNHSLSVAKPAHRKGHKYRHSSVSMNLFQEPEPKLSTRGRLWQIPHLYPIPTINELWNSINPPQKWSAMLSVAHLVQAIVIFLIGHRFKLAPLSTLAHLVFYNALGSLVTVFVNIMSNFEVWSNSSLMHPFGLGRLEVLVGFALGASLVMVGLDLVSHFVEEFILLIVGDVDGAHDISGPVSHHIHVEHGGSTNWIVYQFILVVTIIMTLISSNYISNAGRIKDENAIVKHLRTASRGFIGEEMESTSNLFYESLNTGQKYPSFWSHSPTHLLTLVYSCYLVVLPVIPKTIVSDTEIDLDEMASLIVAILVCHTGWKLVKKLGEILMCLYPRLGYEYKLLRSTICDQVFDLDSFKPLYSMVRFFITKFNYELYVIGIKIQMVGATIAEECALRLQVGKIVRREIEARNRPGSRIKIESTIDIDRL